MVPTPLQGLENVRVLRLELDAFASKRVAEAQILAMESEATNRIGAAAVGFVAHDRISPLRKVNPDLVLASSFQPYLNQRGFRFSAQDMDVRDRGLTDSLVAR